MSTAHCTPLSVTAHFTFTMTKWRLIDWLSCGFTSHSTQNRLSRRRFPKPFSWLCIEKSKPNTKRTHSPIERNVQQQQQQQLPFNGRLSATTRVGRYQKKHSPAHTHPGQRTSFITLLHLQRSMASSLFSLHVWQSSRTTSFQVLFGLPLGLEPSTSYSMHFFTQSSSSFRSTCPYQRSLFCCNIMLCHLHLVSHYTMVNDIISYVTLFAQ